MKHYYRSLGMFGLAAALLLVSSQAYCQLGGGNAAGTGLTYPPVSLAALANGSQSSAVTCNWGNQALGTCTATLTGNVTTTFSNPVTGGEYTVIVTQDATGGRTTTFAGGTFQEPNGEAVGTHEFVEAASKVSSTVWQFDGTNYNLVGGQRSTTFTGTINAVMSQVANPGFMSITGNSVATLVAATEGDAMQPVQVMTCRRLRCVTTNAAGTLTAAGGTSIQFGLDDNTVLGALTCTELTAATVCTDLTHAVTTANADMLDFTMIPTGTPTQLVTKCTMECIY